GAVAIHRGQQNLAGAECDDFFGIVDRVDAGRLAPAMGEYLPARLFTLFRHLLGVNRDHDALVAEFFRRLLDEGAPLDRRGVDRNLIGARRQQRADVFDATHAAADGQRHEAGFRRAPPHDQDNAAFFVARRDVEEAQFVGAGPVIGDRGFDRIAGVAQIDEVDALDDAAVLDVEAGDDAGLEHEFKPRPWRPD